MTYPYLRTPPRELSEVLAGAPDTPARAKLRRDLEASAAADLLTDEVLADLRWRATSPYAVSFVEKPILKALLALAEQGLKARGE